MTMYFTCTRQDSSCKHPSFDLTSQTSTEGDQNDWSSDSSLHFALRPSASNSGHKAKTSLCKNFIEKGFCSYGKKCQFAHGPEELRVNMEHNRSYKTKTCHAFNKKGVCHYGERCNFIHEQGHSSLTTQQWQSIYSNHRETFNTSSLESNSRLLSLLKE